MFYCGRYHRKMYRPMVYHKPNPPEYRPGQAAGRCQPVSWCPPHTACSTPSKSSAIPTFMLLTSWLFILVSPPKLASAQLRFAWFLSFPEVESLTMCSFGSCFIDSTLQLLSPAFVRSEGRVGTHSFLITLTQRQPYEVTDFRLLIESFEGP